MSRFGSVARKAPTVCVLAVLLAVSCASTDGGVSQSVLEAATGQPVQLRVEDSDRATVEVFFGFPVVTLFDFFPSDVDCSFYRATVESSTRPTETDTETRAGRELTPIATYVIRGSAQSEMTCVDHAARDIDLAVIVTE